MNIALHDVEVVIQATKENSEDQSLFREHYKAGTKISEELCAKYGLVLGMYVKNISIAYISTGAEMRLVCGVVTEEVNNTDVQQQQAQQAQSQGDARTPVDVARQYNEATGANLSEPQLQALGDLLHQIYKQGHMRGIQEAVQQLEGRGVGRRPFIPPKGAH